MPSFTNCARRRLTCIQKLILNKCLWKFCSVAIFCFPKIWSTHLFWYFSAAPSACYCPQSFTLVLFLESGYCTQIMPQNCHVLLTYFSSHGLQFFSSWWWLYLFIQRYVLLGFKLIYFDEEMKLSARYLLWLKVFKTTSHR